MSEYLQKLLAKAKEKTDAMERQEELGENSKVDELDTDNVSDMNVISDTNIESDTVLISDTVIVSDAESPSDTPNVSDSTSAKNKRQRVPVYLIVPFKIKKMLPKLPPSALMLYVYLHNKAFKRSTSQGIIDYNQRDLMDELGFASHSTIVSAMAALENNNLISWELKSYKKGTRSKIKVTKTEGLSKTKTFHT